MDRFKIGDKVYNKQGTCGEELGTVADIKDGKIIVRQFSNNIKEDYHPEEIYNEQEHNQLYEAWISQTPKDDLSGDDPY